MNIKYQYIDTFRGDDCYIPLAVEIPLNAIYRIQLRRNTDATEYHILDVVENKVYLPASLTINLLGHYEYDIELEIDGEFSTIQHTDIDFIPDVTRIYGEEIPIEPLSDFERKTIIGSDFKIRDENNNLISLGTNKFKKIDVSGVQNFSNRNFQLSSPISEGYEPILFLNGLFVFNDNNYIISGTTLILTDEMYAPGPNDSLILLS